MSARSGKGTKKPRKRALLAKVKHFARLGAQQRLRANHGAAKAFEMMTERAIKEAKRVAGHEATEKAWNEGMHLADHQHRKIGR